jgi:hypothetical protein
LSLWGWINVCAPTSPVDSAPGGVSVYNEIAADAAQVFAEFGKEIQWKDRAYPALISEPAFSQEFETGGFADAGDFTIKLLRATLLHGIPRLGDRIAFNGEDYRVVRVTDRPPHPLIILVLSTPDA